MFDKKLIWLYAFLIPIEIVIFFVLLDNPKMILFFFAFLFNFVVIVNPFYGLVTLLLVTPIFDPKVYLFVNVYAHTLLIILVFFSLIINMAIGRIKLKFNISDIMFLFFSIAIGLSVLNSLNILRSIKASLDIFQFVLAFIVFSKTIKSLKEMYILVDCIIFSTPIAVILGIFSSKEYRGGGYVIANPNDYAAYLLTLILFLIGISLISKNKGLILKSSVAILLGSLGLLLTYSRGAYLALGISGMLGIILAFNFRSIILSCLGFIGVLPFIPKMIMRFTNVSEVATISFREEMFKFGIKHLKDHIYFGIGIGMVEIYALMPGVFWAIRAHRNLHNMYLQFVVECGIPALIIFIVIIIYNLFKLFFSFLKTKNIEFKSLYLGLLLAIIGVCVHGLVETILQNVKINYYFGMMFGISIAIKYIEEKEIESI